MEAKYFSEKFKLDYGKVVRIFLNIKRTARNNYYLLERLCKLQSNKSKSARYPGIHSC